ncbi:hypothetical protein DV702_16630 [Sporosarcina sp. PTS2304]|uniref:Ig-like domain-containing protein n=1 Tax=Sporosarcina sp. PTS2304 TaxID=2283194 RepID=UPI000E0E06FF|nr:Ig-like domain-containing protein [Sporosarcina sp. PTS2304]AXI01203.1 hypothetical protein DV702_16630 [Sporosarcina sp. PTS2304]
MIRKRKSTTYAVLSTVAFTAMIGTPAIIAEAAIVFSGTTTVQGEIRITTPTQLTDQTGSGALNNATVILAPTLPVSSFDLTGINPANLVIENNNVGILTVSPAQNITVTLAPGVINSPAVIGGGIVTFVSPQTAPTNLTGVAPTVMDNDGKITGTTVAMEYRLKGAASFTPVTATEITGIVAGKYEVRFAAKPGYAAGAITEVLVPAYSGPPAIPVTGITLDQSNVADLEVGSGAIEAKKTVQLTAAVAPANATNQSVTWTSSNPAVATVSNTGLVTAISAGNTTISATTVNGKIATSAITVTTKTAVTSATITGTEQVDQTLTAIVNGDATNPTYQWQVADTINGPYTNIAGAIDSTFVVTAAQEGKFIRVVISGANESKVTSDSTTAITPK